MPRLPKKGKGRKLPMALLYEHLNNIPNRFRNALCEECGWSMPTFYRKVRNGKPKASNAELKAANYLVGELFREVEQYIKTLDI